MAAGPEVGQAWRYLKDFGSTRADDPEEATAELLFVVEREGRETRLIVSWTIAWVLVTEPLRSGRANPISISTETEISRVSDGLRR